MPIGRGIQIQHVGMQIDDFEPGPLEVQSADVEPGGPGFEFVMIGEVNRRWTKAKRNREADGNQQRGPLVFREHR